MELTIEEVQYLLDALDHAWMYADLSDEPLPPVHNTLHDKFKQELIERAKYGHIDGAA